MVKYHIDNWITRTAKDMYAFSTLTEEEHERLYSEIKNATLQGLEGVLQEWYDYGTKIENDVQSLLLWVLGLALEKPTGPQKIKSAGSFCDIDLDFSQEKRNQVYQYLVGKYGEERVSHIATFGTMAAKGAVRNAARALGYPTEVQNKVAKFIPNNPGITIKESIDSNTEFQDALKSEPETKHIIETALKLEGLPNSIGTHASAYVISDVAITEYMPLMASTKKNMPEIATQIDMKDVEAMGHLKYDLLGLKTLDIIDLTVKTIKKYRNIDVDIHAIDVNDESIYKLLNDGYTTLIFQFDGTAAAYLPKIKPVNINEISDLTSILRPGPMSMGMVEQYANAKFRNEKFDYNLNDKNLLEKVWEICNTSYGLLIYQEQAIKCFVEIAGFDEIGADNARRAMGKFLPFIIVI